jgi:hypothetical protein
LPASIDAYLLGGGGDDEFHVYNDFADSNSGNDTTATLLGQVLVSLKVSDYGVDESAGNDFLLLRDVGDTSADTIAFAATRLGQAPSQRVVTTIDGLFDAGTGVDVTYSQVERLTLELGSGSDTVNMDFQGLSDELAVATILGNQGDETYQFLTSSGMTNDMTLHGHAGTDKFVFADAAILYGVGSLLDGGAGVDTVDFTAYLSGRELRLEGQALVDGYWGYEDGWADGARFDNIDSLLASNAAGDTVRGPALDTFWRLTGKDTGTVWNLPTAVPPRRPSALDPCDFEDTCDLPTGRQIDHVRQFRECSRQLGARLVRNRTVVPAFGEPGRRRQSGVEAGYAGLPPVDGARGGGSAVGHGDGGGNQPLLDRVRFGLDRVAA